MSTRLNCLVASTKTLVLPSTIASAASRVRSPKLISPRVIPEGRAQERVESMVPPVLLFYRQHLQRRRQERLG
ncbi:hypothetical protein E2C01_094449 [Portunus trituberculatus]|uniref:Uncharacterized protein n=1 Tax=Portunus trituberculatus TaxID=210409 RepID=A0A5B7JX70_PORTR|nr:hypothetical protein [Portunus trituberculatus]